MKKCSVCKEDKPLSAFSKNKSRKDGLNASCKKCHSIYRKNYYILNREKEIETNNKWREDNGYHKGDIQVNCSVCNKLIWRRKRDLNKYKNNFCSHTCRSNFMDKGIINYYIKEAKTRANLKKLDFNLNYEFLYDLFYNKQNEKCAVTGIELKLVKRKEIANIYESASIDRIDNNKGYTQNNVRFVVLGINYMKNRKSDEELFELIKRIKSVV